MTQVSETGIEEQRPDAVAAPRDRTGGRGVPLARMDLLAASLRVLGSFGFAVVLLLILTALTFFGTLYQVEHGLFEAQKRFFDSLFFVATLGPFGIPLPGARLVLLVFGVNLIVGGLLRIRKSTATFGIIIAHLGILLMLVAGEVKYSLSTDGHLKIWPNETKDEYESYFNWEIEISEQLENGQLRQHIIPHEDFANLELGESRRFVAQGLPFDLSLFGFTRNSWPVSGGHASSSPDRGRAIEGWRLEARPRNPSAENNFAGAYAVLTEKGSRKQHELILWGIRIDPRNGTLADPLPAVLEIDGTRWGIRMRHERYKLPFEIHLERFKRVLHPGTARPKSFESDILLIDGGERRPVNISMNEPLRHAGHVVFQSGWGPQDPSYRGDLYSDFSIVDNPADQWPLYSCIVIAVGLLMHFTSKLFKYVRKERARVQKGIVV